MAKNVLLLEAREIDSTMSASTDSLLRDRILAP
jgi:hypothetical protein